MVIRNWLKSLFAQSRTSRARMKACQVGPEKFEERLLLSSVTGSVSEPKQIITPSQEEFSRNGAEAVSFQVMYNTAPGDETLSGFEFRMHFNSSLLTFVSVTDILDNGFAEASASAPLSDVNDDFDGDPDTDQFVAFSFSDAANTFPGEALPVSLGTAMFTTAAGFSGETTVNFSALTEQTLTDDRTAFYNFEAGCVRVSTPDLTVTIAQNSLSPTDSTSDVAFEFSGSVTDFDESDVTVTGGVLSDFSGSGSSYSAIYTANEGLQGTGTVSVAAGAYTDPGANPGDAASDSVAIDTTSASAQFTFGFEAIASDLHPTLRYFNSPLSSDAPFQIIRYGEITLNSLAGLPQLLAAAGNDPSQITITVGSNDPGNIVEVISLASFDNGLSDGVANQTYQPNGSLSPSGSQADMPTATISISGTPVAQGTFEELSLDVNSSGQILTGSTGRIRVTQAVGEDSSIFDEYLAATGDGLIEFTLNSFNLTGPATGFGDSEFFTSTGSSDGVETNESPTIGVNQTLSVNDGQTAQITTTLLNESDPDDSGFGLTYTITSGPSSGVIELNGSTASSFTQADIDAGRVAYRHTGGESETDSFSFSLADGGENGAGQATGIFNVSISLTNDPPVIDTNTGATVDEGVPHVLTTDELSASDVDNTADQLTFTIETPPVNGTIEVGGSSVTSFTQAQLVAGDVSYVHDGSETTMDSFEFRVTDGAETVPDPGGAAATFDITVMPVNDPPTITVTQTVPELDEDADTSARTKVADITINDVDGGTNVARLSGARAAQFEIDGTELYLVAGAMLDHETGDPLTVDVEAHDDSINGTAREDFQTVSITINDVNETPSFTDGSPLDVTVAEGVNNVALINATDPDDPEMLKIEITGGADMALFTIDSAFGVDAPSGGLSRQLVFDGTPPAFNEGGDNDYEVILTVSDDDGLTGETLTVNVTVAQFGIVPPVSAMVFENQTDAIDLDAVVTQGDTPVFSIVDNGTADDGQLFAIDSATGIVTFKTAPDFESPADLGGDNVYEFTARVVDQTLTEGATQPITISVKNVDEAPVFSIPTPSHTSGEDPTPALVTVPNFATGISAIEPSQTGSLDFVFTSTGTTGGLTFDQAPDIDSTGTLTYQATADSNGSATFDVVLTDSGSTDNGGANQSSPAVPVTITVNAVNDAPVIDPVSNPAPVDEDNQIGPLAVTLSDVDTDLNSVTLTGTSDNQTLIPNSSIVITGTGASRMVTIQPALNQSGSATITLVANDGVDDSEGVPFTVTVNAVNDPPVLATNTGLSVRELETRTITTTQLETTDVDDGPAELTYTVTTAPTAGTLLFDGGTLPAMFTQQDINDGRLSYQHTSEEITADSFTFTVADGGEDDAAAIEEQTFEIRVLTILSEIPDQTFGTDLGSVTIPVAAAIIDGDVPALTALLSDDTMLPGFISFESTGPGTGLFTFDPQSGDEGEYEIKLNATTMDGTDFITFNANVVTGPTDISNETVHFVNVGGPGLANPSVSADLGSGSSSIRNTGNTFGTRATINVTDESIPDGTPAAIFRTQRWDAASGPEMQFAFPVDPGDYRVNLFFAELYGPTSRVGARVFDVALEGEVEFNDVDVFSEVGQNAGLVKSAVVTADSTLNITFLHQVENPIVSAIQIINLNPVPSQTAPRLQAIGNRQASEGQTVTIDVRAQDAEGDDVTFDVQGLPTFATFVDNENGTGRITVNAIQGDTGEYPLTITATQENGVSLTDAESFVLSVLPTNDPPTLDVNGLLTVAEGGMGTIGSSLLSGSDLDDVDETLTYTITSGPSHGTIEVDGQSASSFSQNDIDTNLVRYVHDGGESTSDTFRFSLADGGEDGVSPVTADFNITITPVNDSPTITISNNLTVRSGSTRRLTVAQLSAADPDDTPSGLTYTVTSGPGEGVILVDGNELPGDGSGTFTQQNLIDGLVEYRNDNDQATMDSFTVELADGGEDGASTDQTTISITISDVTIIAPIPDQTIAAEAGPVDIPVAAALVDGVAAMLTESGVPGFGTFTDNGNGTGIFTFDPVAADVGSSTIELTATAGDVVETISFSLEVVSVPTQVSNETVHFVNVGGPAVINPPITGDLGGSSTIRNTGTRFDSSTTINLSDGSIPEGTPASIFRTQRWDGPGGPEMQFSFPVDPGDYRVNLYFAELYGPTSRVGARVFDVAIEGNLAIDNLDVFSEVGANAGLVQTVDVTADSTLDIAFLHQIQNPIISAIQIINLNPVPAQTAPVLQRVGNITVNEGQTTTITVAAVDAEGDDAQPDFSGLPSFVSASEPIDGAVTFTISPSEGDAGQYPISGTITQVGEFPLTDAESIVLTVVGVNEPPVLTVNTPLSVTEGGMATIDAAHLNSADPDDGPGELTFSFTMTDPPANGQIFVDGNLLMTGSSFTQADINAGDVEYRHDGSEAASDSFGFTLTDGGEDGAAAVSGTFIINVSPVNDAPVLDVNGGLNIREGATRTISTSELSSSDVDNDPSGLRYTVTSAPTAGTLRVNGTPSSVFTQGDIDARRVTYSQDGTVSASDSFDFALSDGSASPLAGTFLINITEEPPFELDVNAGGPAVDGFVPAGGLQNGAGSRFGTRASIDVSDPSVDTDIPPSVFQTVLYDSSTGADLEFDVELEAGVSYEVTLLFSEVYGPTFRPGARVFDVSIDGNLVLDNFDIFATAGAGNRAVARAFTVVSDGNLDINLGSVVQNPAIAGFRIREIDDAFSDPGSLLD